MWYLGWHTPAGSNSFVFEHSRTPSTHRSYIGRQASQRCPDLAFALRVSECGHKLDSAQYTSKPWNLHERPRITVKYKSRGTRHGYWTLDRTYIITVGCITWHPRDKRFKHPFRLLHLTSTLSWRPFGVDQTPGGCRNSWNTKRDSHQKPTISNFYNFPTTESIYLELKDYIISKINNQLVKSYF